MEEIVFKYTSDEKIPDDLYDLTYEQVGFSQLDDCPVYSIRFDCDLGILHKLYDDNYTDNIFSDINKHLRKYKIQKIRNNMKGETYENKDLEKLAIFLEYYYTSEGNINIIG